MSKKLDKKTSSKKTAPNSKGVPQKENASGSAAGPFQPHNAKKEGLGPNTNR